MTVLGCDISSNQAGLSLAAVRQAGYRFVTARALSFPKGIMEPDPSYAGFRDEAQRLGLLFSAYVLIHTYLTPAEQAVELARVIGNPGIPVMVDLEPDSDLPTVDFAAQFWDACLAEGLLPRVLYDPRWYWTEHAQPLLSVRPWRLTSSSYGSNAPGSGAGRYAAEGGDTGPGWAPYGALEPVLWQFGSQIVLGTDQTGKTVYGDGDAYRGTLDQLDTTGLFTNWSGGNMTMVGLDPADPTVERLLAAIGPYDTNHPDAPVLANLMHVLEGIRDGAAGFESVELVDQHVTALAAQLGVLKVELDQVAGTVATLAAQAGHPVAWQGTISVTPTPAP